ncbi:MAG TPA: Fur family transcriptional regulator [Pirellulaceae bacterium]|nr:Fur family transcriptional regulator [Pirellulaceae bacterium]HMO93863.1 Fur family transcriptional regulator [Pirellulaceae bacterium]HMP71123.1 Fur family transcriptional regulator [Pirellulaceae bacterium]
MRSDSPLERIETASSPAERFEEYLHIRGMRNTEQRRLLLEHVFKKHQHFDVDQLIEQLPRKGQVGYVSRPTVYRTLTEFVEAGLLRKIELDGRSVYEHDYGYPQHDHMYCNECLRLIEFRSARLEEIHRRVAEEHGFQVSHHRLIICGICRACRESRRRKRRRVDMI